VTATRGDDADQNKSYLSHLTRFGGFLFVLSLQQPTLIDVSTAIHAGWENKPPSGGFFILTGRSTPLDCVLLLTNKREHLGYFDCPDKAHIAWKKRKHEIACQIADMQDNACVASALRNRYCTGYLRLPTEKN
jgi:hypothetical protein